MRRENEFSAAPVGRRGLVGIGGCSVSMLSTQCGKHDGDRLTNNGVSMISRSYVLVILPMFARMFAVGDGPSAMPSALDDVDSQPTA